MNDRPEKYYCDECGHMEKEYGNPFTEIDKGNMNIMFVCDDCLKEHNRKKEEEE